MPRTATTSQDRQTPRRRGIRANLDLIGLRVNDGLSREDLARRIGCSRETIRLVESGWVPTPRVQFAIAQAFDRRPLDLWPIERQKGVK